MTIMASEPITPSDLDWIQLRKDISGPNYNEETMKEKLVRKVYENPLVPIGCLATAGALSYGLWSFRNGRSRMSQKMMRLRVLAQGFTIVALVGGVLVTNRK